MALQELSEKFGGTWKMESEENIAKYLEAMGEILYFFVKFYGENKFMKEIENRHFFFYIS